MSVAVVFVFAVTFCFLDAMRRHDEVVKRAYAAGIWPGRKIPVSQLRRRLHDAGVTFAELRAARMLLESVDGTPRICSPMGPRAGTPCVWSVALTCVMWWLVIGWSLPRVCLLLMDFALLYVTEEKIHNTLRYSLSKLIHRSRTPSVSSIK